MTKVGLVVENGRSLNKSIVGLASSKRCFGRVRQRSRGVLINCLSYTRNGENSSTSTAPMRLGLRRPLLFPKWRRALVFSDPLPVGYLSACLATSCRRPTCYGFNSSLLLVNQPLVGYREMGRKGVLFIMRLLLSVLYVCAIFLMSAFIYKEYFCPCSHIFLLFIII